MKNTFASLAVAITAVFGAISASHAAVIDFNGLSGAPYPGAYAAYGGLYTYVDGPVSLNGFTITPYQPHAYQYFAGDLNAMIFCRGWNDHCAANGTDHLLTSPSLTITRSDGGAFKLNAFDLGNYFDSEDGSNPAQSVFRVEATRSNGEIVSRTIMLDDVPNYMSSSDFNHFTFDGFTDITSVNVNLLTKREWNSTVLDNLDVTAAGPGQVPEPASLALLGIGLAGLVRGRRRA